MKEVKKKNSLIYRLKRNGLRNEYLNPKTNSVFEIFKPKIFGTFSPTIYFTGWSIAGEPSIEVKIGDKHLEIIDNSKETILSDLHEINGVEAKSFAKTARLPRISKRIDVVVKSGDKVVYRATLSNNICLRIIGKILNSNNIVLRSIFSIFKGLRFLWREHHFLVPPRMIPVYWRRFFIKLKDSNSLFLNPNVPNEYRLWVKKHEVFSEVKDYDYNPKISILVPVYDVPIEYLRECIESIINQTYENWELCIADDCSKNPKIKETLDEYVKRDKRIKALYREKNGHISAASNSALEIATGEYIGLLDNDDIIPSKALNEVLRVLNKDRSIDMIYSDEDKLDTEGKRCNPNFKPDFAPDTLLGCNYICHFSVLRKSIVDEIGGFRLGFEGVQDHDLFLRFSEKTDKIYHISKMLYHWRMIPGSTSMSTDNKSYIGEKGIKMVEEALFRRGTSGKVTKNPISFWYEVEYDYNKDDLISIIIPTKNHGKVLEDCLKSIYKKTTYENFEIIIVDNGSTEKKALEVLSKYKKEHENIEIITLDCPFNYSYLNNEAIKIARGKYIVLLNNDTEVITKNWLELMLGHASQDHIGVVGAKLLYPDRTIQHAGVYLGVGGVATHGFCNLPEDAIATNGALHITTNFSAQTAACIMFSKEKGSRVNFLDENLHVAYNDVDFNLKMQGEGYYNVLVPKVLLFHHESKSRGLDTTSEKYERFLKENKMMYEKWGEIINRDPFYNENLSLRALFMLEKEEQIDTPINIFINQNDADQNK